MDITNYKLCYVECLSYNTFMLYFSNNEKISGDDWNDTPADVNASEPYEDENSKIYKCVIGINNIDYVFSGKYYSVDDLNDNVAAWLSVDRKDGNNKLLIRGKDTFNTVIKNISVFNKSCDDTHNIEVYLDLRFMIKEK